MIKRFFSPPVFDNEEKNSKARLLNGISWIVIALVLAAIIPISLSEYEDFTVFVLLGIIAVFAIVIVLIKRGFVNLGAILVVTMVSLFLCFQAYTADGVRDVILIGFLAIALLASLAINIQVAIGVLVFGIGLSWVLALLETNNLLKPTLDTPLNYARDLTIMFLIVTSLIYYVIVTLRRSSKQAQISMLKMQETNEELRSLRVSLEERIEKRTVELELANQRYEKRARQFEAIAQVARATATNENLDSLLPRLTSLISTQFGFYHTGIFLIDEERKYAVLRAANSEGGKRMLEHEHKLQIGQTGIVGFVSALGTPRIALDVGSDAVFFDNPYLPNTRSEMALPLRVADEIIGVLDVQSTESNAFKDEDVTVLSTLADQVSIAIQSSRSYETMQDILREAQKTSGTYLQDVWQTMQGEQTNVGYLVTEGKINPLIKPISSAPIRKAIENKQTVSQNGETAMLIIPIRLRDEVIGIVDIRTPDDHEWDNDEVDIAEAVADRLSLALETSLLLKSTQRRAEIERITADISGKISATTQFDSILRTAAEELSRVLGGSEVLVQIQSLDTLNGPES